MIYQGFAGVYDVLMTHAPYDEWVQWIQQYMKPNAAIIDVGCGTGEISLRLAEKGHKVTGIDLSEEMLAFAQQKAQAKKQSIQFLHQDMREVTGFEQAFQAAVICCDSLNYLKNENDVKKTFKNMFQLLEADGVLLFDVHTPYKMEKVFPGSTYADQDEEISYIWQSDKGDDMYSVIHDLSFFVKDGDMYQRYDETHEQRTFPFETYAAFLESAGFEQIEVTADFTNEAPGEFAERYFISAKKPKTIV
ncbi:class I SAM-dependent DNA methyltransferase [Bacillus safensis]|uniref:class I SAM-dependent DNA methyltransferase n=1 Tax=Bacillus safensis TaxID=561879 RepID=UPI000B450D59|nr:class I SAM-dependent methyltransferase [Bacillus safensis]PAK34631.1 class I SAM-dependent methyltransferase [Bacillus safensis]UDB49966.1 class I SAM-dependent methyltransferase [Bacillus safensis]